MEHLRAYGCYQSSNGCDKIDEWRDWKGFGFSFIIDETTDDHENTSIYYPIRLLRRSQR